MPDVNYIILHPDHQRPKVAITATGLQTGNLINFKGDVWTDQLSNGLRNEDPYVFSDPWLYSYCHAPQLRRNIHRFDHVEKDSYLFFCSGDFADKDTLTIDTVFCVKQPLLWQKKSKLIPSSYSIDQKKLSELWHRHFKFGTNGYHPGLYTYEANMYSVSQTNFSYLPLGSDLMRLSIPFKSLPKSISGKIITNRKGKRPSIIDAKETQQLLQVIDKHVKIKVLENIRETNPSYTPNIKGTAVRSTHHGKTRRNGH